MVYECKNGISDLQLREALAQSLQGKDLKKY